MYMKWYHHYASERNSENLQVILCDPDFGLKGYALYFLIKEILYEKMETYTKKDYVSMTIGQWCAGLYTKWKVLKRFLDRYSKNLNIEYEIKSNPAPLAAKRPSNHILIIKSPKALSELESRMSKNNKNYKNSKNNKNSENNALEREKKVFVKPTLEEINDYIKTKNYDVDPERFFNFYESKGWKVGNQAMKDWMAAVRTWQVKDKHKALEQQVGKQAVKNMESFKQFNEQFEKEKLIQIEGVSNVGQ